MLSQSADSFWMQNPIPLSLELWFTVLFPLWLGMPHERIAWFWSLIRNRNIMGTKVGLMKHLAWFPIRNNHLLAMQWWSTFLTLITSHIKTLAYLVYKYSTYAALIYLVGEQDIVPWRNSSLIWTIAQNPSCSCVKTLSVFATCGTSETSCLFIF